MKIINWNISWLNSIETKAEYLLDKVGSEPFIIILQEVKIKAYEYLKETFKDTGNIEYSLNYRVPGKYDNDSRKLGVAIITSKDMKVRYANTLNRTIMPDRTLFLELEYNGQILRVIGLHSVTGVHHLKAKELQYFGFAEAIDEFKPDIVGIDANEPQTDHYDISRMEFFDNYCKGKGCQSFFNAMVSNGLSDSFVKYYDVDSYIQGQPLTTSYIIKRGNKKVRYDFIFINEEKLPTYKCLYDYKGAVAAGSDHAAIIVEVF
ncbi:MAG: hypothetical protein E7235_01020 [Lachnospiraceae bacterium]|nr:hypothetical protein [Lachnospiraceae bacterium]